MKSFRHALILVIAVLIGTGLAQSTTDSSTEGALNAATPATAYTHTNGLIEDDTVTTMDVDCGRWRGWFTSSTYCDDTAGCLRTTQPGEGRFEDQYQWRECHVTETGETWKEYQFRVVRTDCCGDDLP